MTSSSKKNYSQESHKTHKEYSSKSLHTSLRRKPSLYWDVPASGYEYLQPMEYKALLAIGQLTTTVREDMLHTTVPLVGPIVTHQARRLYIGNIPPSVVELDILNFFNQQMHVQKLAQTSGNPILRVHISHDRTYGFLEFRSIDETTQALIFDGINFQGRIIKVRRPHLYQPINQMETGIESESPNKIFIGGLPMSFNDEQLREMLEPFGQLNYSYVVGRESQNVSSKFYAFCEFLSPTSTTQAIETLNGVYILDHPIRVQLASQVPKLPTIKIQKTRIHCTNIPNLGFSRTPTPVLCFLNMISPDELKDESEALDILNDILEECRVLGTVRSYSMPLPKDHPLENCGRVYVEFITTSDCQRAQNALSGRKFNGRVVVAAYYDWNLFKQEIL